MKRPIYANLFRVLLGIALGDLRVRLAGRAAEMRPLGDGISS
jgi:hypothetical protein